MNVIARVGEVRTETYETAQLLESTGSFEIVGIVEESVEESAEESAEDVEEEPEDTPQDVPGEGDTLLAISGIGPARWNHLQESGITTFAQLAAIDTAELAEAMNVNEEEAADWVEQAQALAA